jgi:hypothetical protein
MTRPLTARRRDVNRRRGTRRQSGGASRRQNHNGTARSTCRLIAPSCFERRGTASPVDDDGAAQTPSGPSIRPAEDRRPPGRWPSTPMEIRTLTTGASRGVGLDLSRRLAQAGHPVYLGARDCDDGQQRAGPVDLLHRYFSGSRRCTSAGTDGLGVGPSYGDRYARPAAAMTDHSTRHESDCFGDHRSHV